MENWGNRENLKTDLTLIPDTIVEQDDETVIESNNYIAVTANAYTAGTSDAGSGIPEFSSSSMNFNPAYPRFRPSVNTSTFLYHALKISPEHIEYIRNL